LKLKQELTAVAHGWVAPVATAEGDVERYDVNWGRAILAVILPVLALVALVVVILVISLLVALVASLVSN